MATFTPVPQMLYSWTISASMRSTPQSRVSAIVNISRSGTMNAIFEFFSRASIAFCGNDTATAGFKWYTHLSSPPCCFIKSLSVLSLNIIITGTFSDWFSFAVATPPASTTVTEITISITINIATIFFIFLLFTS